MSRGRHKRADRETLLETIAQLVGAGEIDSEGGVPTARLADELEWDQSTIRTHVNELVDRGDLECVDGWGPNGWRPSYLPVDDSGATGAEEPRLVSDGGYSPVATYEEPDDTETVTDALEYVDERGMALRATHDGRDDLDPIWIVAGVEDGRYQIVNPADRHASLSTPHSTRKVCKQRTQLEVVALDETPTDVQNAAAGRGIGQGTLPAFGPGGDS